MLENLLLHFEILWPAFLAGIIVLSTHVPLGQEVLRRGIIFLDLAIAQIAAFGLILANTLGVTTDTHHGSYLQNLIAVVAAVIGSLLLYRCRKLEAKIQEALIGILFILAATGSILLLAADPNGGERLKELLIGQILWIQASELILITLIYITVLAIWYGLRNKIGEWIFYPLFAVTITFSTQLIGVYLVFASLILPALATINQRRPMLSAYCIGFIAYFFGLLLSAFFDLPSGATIAWCLVFSAAIYFVFMGIPNVVKKQID